MPTPEAGKGFNSAPDGGAPTSSIRKGGSLTFSCADSSHRVGDSVTSSKFTVRCGAFNSDSDPYWTLRWDHAVADWPACAEPTDDTPDNCPAAAIDALSAPSDLSR